LRLKTKFYPNSFTAGQTIFEGKSLMVRYKELTMKEKILGALGFTYCTVATCCICSKCGCCTALTYGCNVLCGSCCGGASGTCCGDVGSCCCGTVMALEGAVEPLLDNNIANA